MADTEDLVKRYRKQNDVEGEEGGGESSYTFKEGVLIEVKNHELDNPYDYESVARLKFLNLNRNENSYFPIARHVLFIFKP